MGDPDAGERIPYTMPSITNVEINYVLDAVSRGWGTHCYDYLPRFEGAFGEHLGTDYAVSTSSATGALHLGLAALGIGAGDEVIVPDITWIASVAPIAHLGATIRFADIDPHTWCISPSSVEALINSRTRAVVAVHLYGNPADVVRLREICAAAGIFLVEDAAEAIGTLVAGARAGTFGHFAVFSFHGTKTITTGEGGMLVTGDKELADRVRILNDHGRSPDRATDFAPEVLGYKFKMSNIQAALGLGQLERIGDLIDRKLEILSGYRHRLGHFPNIRLNTCSTRDRLGGWMPTVEFTGQPHMSVKRLRETFRLAGIDTRPVFPQLTSLRLFRPSSDACPAARHFSLHAINLPSYHNMKESEIDRVCETLVDVVEKVS